jgi:small subunit ribosomal protein S5
MENKKNQSLVVNNSITDTITDSEQNNTNDSKNDLQKEFIKKKFPYKPFHSKKLVKRKIYIRLSKLNYQEKVLDVERVTKVVKGGKKMTYRAILVVGDSKRKVGVGIGRAEESNLAIEKALLNGKKHLITVPLTFNYSVPYKINSSYGACSLILKPASLGSGVIAGGSIRTVLELGGIKNVIAKQLGAKNLLNNAKATILALSALNEKVALTKSQSLRRFKISQKLMKNSDTI